MTTKTAVASGDPGPSIEELAEVCAALDAAAASVRAQAARLAAWGLAAVNEHEGVTGG